MTQRIGTRLVERGVLTMDGLKQALERQRVFGGRLGHNLRALDLITDQALSDIFTFSPAAPHSVNETGLELSFLSDLLLKHALYLKSFSIPLLAEKTKLTQPVVKQCIDALRDDHMVEVTKGDASFALSNYRYRITGSGITRALNLLEESHYIGPAPVPLEAYCYAVEIQTVKSIEIDPERFGSAFSNLVVSENMIQTFGAAVNSGKPIFLYGPPGNGKTSVAETIGRAIGGEVYIPHAIVVGGQIIVVYDEVNHHIVKQDPEDSDIDQRWLHIKRPFIQAGGELSLRSLDLEFNANAKYYEAPLQMKANNGLLVLDDFGRQNENPLTLLNRWIVPLDRRIDFLTLHTGIKFEIPFDELVIFATNIAPKKLADEAFLRRLRYKVKIGYPDEEAFSRIFQKVCESNGLIFESGICNHLLSRYKEMNRIPCGCHPRDMIDQIIDRAHYLGEAPKITKEAIDSAWAHYFADN